mmetsp:Transcript_28730/g.44264  ORF Transcript_28730/g.44264 Transcript_28730/m.44264 type:complete len:81 (+) Transcript_28730:520-762(+)
MPGRGGAPLDRSNISHIFNLKNPTVRTMTCTAHTVRTTCDGYGMTALAAPSRSYSRMTVDGRQTQKNNILLRIIIWHCSR